MKFKFYKIFKMIVKTLYLVLFLSLSLRKARVLRIVLKPFKYYKTHILFLVKQKFLNNFQTAYFENEMQTTHNMQSAPPI